MSDQRRSSIVWGVRRAKTLQSKVGELAQVIDDLTKRTERFAGPTSILERDPDAVALALDTLREQHEKLCVANEELHAQLAQIYARRSTRSSGGPRSCVSPTSTRPRARKRSRRSSATVARKLR